MAIQDNGTRDQYVASAAQTVFAYTFEIFDKDDIAVEQNGTLLAEGTNYTVSGVGVDAGGNITLLVGATSGDIITLYRDMALDRVTDYQQNGDFLANEVNDDFDRLWAGLQQNQSLSNIGIRPTVDDPILNSTNTELANIATRGGKVLGFSATGEISYFSSAISAGSFTDVSTTAAMAALVGPVVGNVVQTADFSTGSSGGATYDAVTVGSTPFVNLPNTFSIIVSTQDATICYVLRIEGVVNVKQWGVTGDASTDDFPALQFVLDFVEQEGRVGGMVFAPKSAGYLLNGKLRIGGWTTLKGEGPFSTTLIFPASYASGDCIELGPDESGEFSYSGSYTFGSRLQDLDINASNIYRGSEAAVIISNGAHQPSGLVRVNLRNFVSLGVNINGALGGQVNFALEDVNMQGSTTAPTLGRHIGLLCNGGGIQVTCLRVQVESDNTSPFDFGIRMEKDHLRAIDTHYEGCAVGINCVQNAAGESKSNTIIGATATNDVPVLIQRGSTVNNTLVVLNARAESLVATNLTIVEDNNTGFVRKDGTVENYSSRTYTSKYLGKGSNKTLDTSGEITVTEFEGFFALDTFASAASDDLVTINGSTDGQTITIRPFSTVRDIVIKNGTGNIRTKSDADVSLDKRYKTITLMFDESITTWLEV